MVDEKMLAAIRAVATKEPWASYGPDCDDYACFFCGHDVSPYGTPKPKWDDPANHNTDCPWLTLQEWAARG